MKTKFCSLLFVTLFLFGITACSDEGSDSEDDYVVTIKYEIVPENPMKKDLKVKGFYTALSLDYTKYTAYSLDNQKIGQANSSTGDLGIDDVKVPSGFVLAPWSKEIKMRRYSYTMFSASSSENIIMRIYMDGKLIMDNLENGIVHTNTLNCPLRNY